MRYIGKAMLVASAAFCLNLSAFSQDISLKVSNVTVKEAMEKLKKESGYSFVFSSQDVNTRKRISVSAKDAAIEEVVKQILQGQSGLEYEIKDRKIIIKKASSQVPNAGKKERIKGKVTDANGEPVIGATIMEQGTLNGTITDIDGTFTLDAVVGGLLEVSYIGYKSEVLPVASGKALSVTLKEDTKMLEEVVVVGYGAMKKENLTGSVAQISGKALESRPVTNLSQALQGTVANLNISSSGGGAPGSTQNINIRGYTGFGVDGNGNMTSTSASPLIVIDGVQGGDINSINMEDVESISVLKDAASTAIYGSSAPYGVIIINTKKGKRNSKATITYNNNFGMAQPINLPKMLNSLEFANLYNEAADNAGIARPFTDENIQRIKDYQAGILKDETIRDPSGADSWLTWTGNGNNDWFDIWFKDLSFSQQHNVGVSGGTDKSNYYVGPGL